MHRELLVSEKLTHGHRSDSIQDSDYIAIYLNGI